MKKILLLLLALAMLFPAGPQAQQPPSPPETRLVLLIAVDQFRYDYLTRFRSEYTGGFKRLLTDGAVFTNANLEHYPTVTAIGHATMLSRRDAVGERHHRQRLVRSRDRRRRSTSVTDDTVKPLGLAGAGRRPRRGGCWSARWATS